MSQTATEIMPRLRCDVSLRNEDGITAVELAEQLNQAEVLALLQRQNTKQGAWLHRRLPRYGPQDARQYFGRHRWCRVDGGATFVLAASELSRDWGQGMQLKSASMVASIQATVAGMGNETCSYNITVDEIMGM